MSTQKDFGAARKDDYHYMTSNYSLSFPKTEAARLARWSDDFANFEADLQFQIVESIQSILTRDAYQWCQKEVLRRRVQREIENQHRQNYLAECSRYASAFQRRYLPWFPTGFIDKPLWRNSGLEGQLIEALKKADSKTLEALNEVGLNGRFSNSVASTIRKVLAEASRNSLN